VILGAVDRRVSPSQAARRALARPLWKAAWDRVVMIHYEVEPEALQPQVPFPLDLFEGRAYVSLVAFTLLDLRFAAGGPPLATHSFLNVRTYVAGNGIYFLAEWLSNRFCVLLGPRLYGLPYRHGTLEYRHGAETGRVRGTVRGPDGALDYQARVAPGMPFAPAEEGSLDEFLLERYSAFTFRRGARRRFRVWHEPWRQERIEPEIRRDSLAAATGPWFARARPVAAHYSPGFDEVWMGRPER
jgi:hypothetical protein